jgi:hypothetical protein
MELFHDPATGRVAFSECAARRAGAMVHEELQAKFNVNLGESGVLCALGRDPGLVVKRDPRHFGSTYLMAPPGVLIDCPSPLQVRERPGVEFVRIERPFGTVFDPALSSTNQRIGQVMVSADSPEGLAARRAEVEAWFSERVVTAPAGATARELRAWQRRIRPDDDFGDTSWT